MLRFVDYWGTEVCAFDVHEPHRRLVVSGRSLVETSARRPVGEPASWMKLRDADIADRLHEYLAPSAYVTIDPHVVDAATEIAAHASIPVDAVDAVWNGRKRV